MSVVKVMRRAEHHSPQYETGLRVWYFVPELNARCNSQLWEFQWPPLLFTLLATVSVISIFVNAHNLLAFAGFQVKNLDT
jgi:hypothetical protein